MMKRISLLVGLIILASLGWSSMGYGLDVANPVQDDLIQFAEKGQLAQVKSLVEQGAKINYSTSKGRTALAAAAFAGHIDVVNYLLNKGADVMAGTPSVYYSIGADKTGPNEAIKLIRTRVDAAKKLYSNLVSAVEQNNFEEVEQLLKNGAKPDIDPGLADYQNRTALSPLQIAAQKGYVEIVRLLMVNEASTNIASGPDLVAINTPLQLAALEGHQDVVKLLVSDKGVNLDASNFGSWTALMYACQNNQKEIVDILIKNGADVERKNKDGKSAIDIAQAAGNQEIVKLIQTMDKENNQMTRKKRSFHGVFNVQMVYVGSGPKGTR
jgi:ankyrin repeat protein